MRPATRIIHAEHAAMGSVLQALQVLSEAGPGDTPMRFFDLLRTMLFYLDEFPERSHHPLESNLLFPRLARAVPRLMPVIERLESEHMAGEGRVRDLQQLLLAWELVGDARRGAFVQSVAQYVAFYREHMRIEEAQLLPAAQDALDDRAWAELDHAFDLARDPLAGGHRDPSYDRLFARIVLALPHPLGPAPTRGSAP
jgi:hemerythrin-like domain-containing protein